MSFFTNLDNVIHWKKVPESAVVKVGEYIGVLALPGEDWKNVPVPKSDSVPKAAAAVASTPAPNVTQTQPVHEAVHYDRNL